MKCGFYKLMMLLVASVMLSSCSLLDFLKKDDDDDKSRDIICSKDPEATHGYDLVAVYDQQESSSVTFVKFNDENNELLDRVESFTVEDHIVMGFDENGRFKYMFCEKDSVTVFAANYQGDVADIAMSIGDEIFIEKEYVLSESGRYMPNVELSRGALDQDDYSLSAYFAHLALDLSNVVELGPNVSVSTALLAVSDIFGIVLPESVDAVVDFAAVSTTLYGLTVAGGATISGFLGALISAWSLGEYLGYELAEYLIQKELENLEGMLKSGYGDLKVTLTWSFYADIDLHAYEPNGTHIYYEDPRSYKTGGYLDYDNTTGGPGAIENIFWDKPEAGVYKFYLNYYGGDQSGICTCSVTYKGKGSTYRVFMNKGKWTNFNNIEVSGSRSRAVQPSAISVELRPDNTKKNLEPVVRFE